MPPRLGSLAEIGFGNTYRVTKLLGLFALTGKLYFQVSDAGFQPGSVRARFGNRCSVTKLLGLFPGTVTPLFSIGEADSII